MLNISKKQMRSIKLNHVLSLKPHHFSTSTQQEKSLIQLIKSSSRNNTHLSQIHSHLISSSLFQNPNISLAFLSQISYDTTYTYKVFTQISKPTLSHYNAMIRAYSISPKPDHGFELYREIRRKGLKPDTFSLSFVVKCCVKTQSFCGEQVHCEITKVGLRSDCLLMTTLMGFYSNSGMRDNGCKVFEEMDDRDIVSWNVLIDCYIRNGRTKDVLKVFVMLEEGECGSRPDDITCVLLLKACADLNSLEFGERVYGYVLENGFGKVTNVCNSAVSMYMRCGCVEKAYEVFKNMRCKNVVTWTAVITGLASNGFAKEAIKGFMEMQKMGIVPQEQTFTGVLSACSCSGMIDEGWKFFISMSEDFGLAPNVHHYGCMVDLLGRAGLLDQAYNLVLSMRVTPDATVWRTLLGACRIHRHASLGERVVEHLIELKALEAGDYVLLLNIYSSIGDWEKVLKIRKLMQEKVIQTIPGCSTIEVRGEVHEFIVDDISHPRKREIYDTLDEIGKQLKIAGYVAEITSELHDLGEREKETMFTNHSEKLAIAFGILATPPGTTIRVAKNIRTCVDCHNFAKFVSSVYNREVVIRDRTQFHHFREGYCSCNDYWYSSHYLLSKLVEATSMTLV